MWSFDRKKKSQLKIQFHSLFLEVFTTSLPLQMDFEEEEDCEIHLKDVKTTTSNWTLSLNCFCLLFSRLNVCVLNISHILCWSGGCEEGLDLAPCSDPLCVELCLCVSYFLVRASSPTFTQLNWIL